MSERAMNLFKALNPRSPRAALRPLLVACALAPPLGLVITPPAKAQVTQATSPAAATATAGDAVNRSRQLRPLTNVLAGMSRTAGVSVVADSSVAGASVSLPSEVTTPENLERQIAALVAELPKGATWGRLYLPPARGRGYDGDAVAQYAFAQARLFGKVGGDTPAGTVEFFGQNLPAEKAQPHLAGLNLQPVYLITNPTPSAGLTKLADQSQWNAMTPEQRQKYVQDQATQLASMDPAARNALVQQHFMVFGQLMRQMSPDQRAGIFQGMAGMGGPAIMIRTSPAPGVTEQHDAVIITRPSP